MAHLTVRKSYEDLVRRLNRLPQGAPEHKLLYRILEMLFTEEEAGLVALLPIRPFTARKAAACWNMSLSRAEAVLTKLAGRGLLVDMEVNGGMEYVLPPPMAGFFEFSMMRVRGDIDQKVLAELFFQYLNVEEDFVRELFTDGDTQLGRVFVNETVVPEGNAIHVLDYEKATEVIRSATSIGIGTCYCRHKMAHLDRACDAPMNNCMTFNTTAESLNRHGISRPVDAAEAMALLDAAREHDLVQFGENVRESVNFICNCCGCCCEAMIAAKRFAALDPIHTSNFLPAVDPRLCSGCGRCCRVCPVEVMELTGRDETTGRSVQVVEIDEDNCLGCGVCVKNCPSAALSLAVRSKRVITPLNAAHRTVVMAIERGKLQNLIFDNQVLWSHRALAALLGVILRLPPARRLLAQEQVKSRYMESLVRRFG